MSAQTLACRSRCQFAICIQQVFSLSWTTLSQDNHTIWNVGSACGNDENKKINDDQPQTQWRLRWQKDSLLNLFQGIQFYLVSTNLLAMLRFLCSGAMGVFISRFWVHRLGDERNFFNVIIGDEQEELSHTRIFTTGALSFVSENVGDCCGSLLEKSHWRTTGTLQDGMNFWMYRMILYQEDFSSRPENFPKSSLGGLYMSPSCFQVRSRQS